jgi:hypothetical protein
MVCNFISILCRKYGSSWHPATGYFTSGFSECHPAPAGSNADSCAADSSAACADDYSAACADDYSAACADDYSAACADDYSAACADDYSAACTDDYSAACADDYSTACADYSIACAADYSAMQHHASNPCDCTCFCGCHFSATFINWCVFFTITVLNGVGCIHLYISTIVKDTIVILKLM